MTLLKWTRLDSANSSWPYSRWFKVPRKSPLDDSWPSSQLFHGPKSEWCQWVMALVTIVSWAMTPFATRSGAVSVASESKTIRSDPISIQLPLQRIYSIFVGGGCVSRIVTLSKTIQSDPTPIQLPLQRVHRIFVGGGCVSHIMSKTILSDRMSIQPSLQRAHRMFVGGGCVSRIVSETRGDLIIWLSKIKREYTYNKINTSRLKSKRDAWRSADTTAWWRKCILLLQKFRALLRMNTL